MALKAIIFDFNGVIINDEPIHLLMFQKVLNEEGIALTEKDYYQKYLAYDDQHCFKAILEHAARPIPQEKIRNLIHKKSQYYEAYIQNHLPIFPGVKSCINRLSRHYLLAIASAALKKEILLILKRENLFSKFSAIVAAEDTKKSKPDPESYLLALKKLNRHQKIRPEECLVIEDSIHGIQGAHRASMKCLAITHTYTKKQLKAADLVISNFKELTLPQLRSLFSHTQNTQKLQ